MMLGLGNPFARAWRAAHAGTAAGINRAPRFAGQDGEYASNFVIAHDARLRVVGGHAIRQMGHSRGYDARPPSRLHRQTQGGGRNFNHRFR